MTTERPRPVLPRRRPGASLPPATRRAVGVARVPVEVRWATDEQTLHRLLAAFSRDDTSAGR